MLRVLISADHFAIRPANLIAPLFEINYGFFSPFPFPFVHSPGLSRSVLLSGPSGCFFSFFISPPPFFQTTRKIFFFFFFFFFFSSSKVLGKLRGPQRATAPAQAGVVPTGAGAGASPFFTFYFSVFNLPSFTPPVRATVGEVRYSIEIDVGGE